MLALEDDMRIISQVEDTSRLIPTIKSFKAGTVATHDTIEFAASDFTSYAQVQGAMTQVGANVVIRFDASDAITLDNVSVSKLVSADFNFVSMEPMAVVASSAAPAGAILLGQYAAGFSAAHDSGKMSETARWL